MLDPITAVALVKVGLDVLDKILYLRILDVESQPASVRADRAVTLWEDEQRLRALLAPILALLPAVPPVEPKKTRRPTKMPLGKMSYEPPCPLP